MSVCDSGGGSRESERYDAVMCLGASFIWNGLPGTLAALSSTVCPHGFVAVGEPYWRTWPLPERAEPDEGEDYLTLLETVERFRAAELTPITLIDASLDDWDRYEALHWLAVEEWLNEHPNDPDAGDIRALTERYRERYLSWQRDLLGWAMIVGRKPSSASDLSPWDGAPGAARSALRKEEVERFRETRIEVSGEGVPEAGHDPHR